MINNPPINQDKIAEGPAIFAVLKEENSQPEPNMAVTEVKSRDIEETERLSINFSNELIQIIYACYFNSKFMKRKKFISVIYDLF